MLGIRPSLVRLHQSPHQPQDFSIFECNNGDAFEPLPIDRPRTAQQAAAVNRVFQDTIRLLRRFETTTNESRRGQEQQVGRQAAGHEADGLMAQALCSSPFAFPATSNESIQPANSHEIQRINGIESFDSIVEDEDPFAFFERAPLRSSSSWASDEAYCSDCDGIPPQDEDSLLRFRPYQNKLWDLRFKEILKFRKKHGHCCVPHTYPQNPSLARWVKRQRYQYKLRIQDKEESTLTNRRLQALEQIGFIWDSNVAIWEERLNDLKAYRQLHGHCEVPPHYQENRKLAIWVKCQRREYELFREGRHSTMTNARVAVLNEMGFSWEMQVAKRT